jgi:hypothetical protein
MIRHVDVSPGTNPEGECMIYQKFLHPVIFVILFLVSVEGCAAPQPTTDRVATGVTEAKVVAATLTAQPPIASPTYTALPIPNKTSTPKPTLTPISTPFAPSTINIKDIRDLLFNQTSFIFRIPTSVENEVEATYIKEPVTIYMRIYSNGAVFGHWIKMGKREWYGIGTKPDLWYSKGQPLLDEKGITSDIFDAASMTWGFLTSDLGMLPDEKAKLVHSAVLVDGIMCNEYEWSRNQDVGLVYIAVESGLPVKSEATSGQYTTSWYISHINDPANVIRPPLTDYPDKLYIDEARMSLNGLSSFQWKTIWSIEDQENSISTFRGTYVLKNQAWHSFCYADTEARKDPSCQLMTIGQKSWFGLGI